MASGEKVEMSENRCHICKQTREKCDDNEYCHNTGGDEYWNSFDAPSPVVLEAVKISAD